MVDLDRAFKLAYQSLLRIELLFGSGVFGDQVFVAGQVDLCVFQLRRVACQRAFGLRGSCGKGARVNLRQNLPGLDLLTFLELDALQHTADLRPHHGRVGGRQATDGVDHHTNVLLARSSHGYWLGTVTAAKAT